MKWIKLESVDQIPKDGTKFFVYYRNPNDAFDFIHKRKAPYEAINFMGYSEEDDDYFTYFHEFAYTAESILESFSHICFVEEPEGIDWKPNFTIKIPTEGDKRWEETKKKYNITVEGE